MPDVQEVFRLVTQKVRPDPGALDRQLVNQRRSIRRRRLGVYALVGVLATAALIVALGTVWGDRVRPIDVGRNPNDAPRALDYREYGDGRSVVAQGEDLGYRWTLSDQRPDTDDGACLLIGGENVCYHIDRETPFFVECLAQGGGYLLAASGLEVDRTWIDVEGAGTIEGRWMPFRSPEEEMRAWLLFLPGTGNGTLRIGRSFEQPVSWAPCGD
jgi:hypothetical protein